MSYATAPLCITFLMCISNSWDGSHLSGCALLHSPPKALQHTWEWGPHCVDSSALLMSCLDALAEILGSPVDTRHPGVKWNYHYKKSDLFMPVICSCVCVLLHCIKLPLKI